jgi:CRP-like cAMP-binding protein
MPQQNEQDLQTITRILQNIPLFAELNSDENKEVIKKITMDYFPENHILFKEGDAGDKMYIIKTGIVRIFLAGDTPSFDKEVAMLGDNDFFGEMALISDTNRNATAKVVEASQLFILSKEDMLKLISENPSIAAKISNEFLKRLKADMRATS